MCVTSERMVDEWSLQQRDPQRLGALRLFSLFVSTENEINILFSNIQTNISAAQPSVSSKKSPRTPNFSNHSSPPAVLASNTDTPTSAKTLYSPYIPSTGNTSTSYPTRQNSSRPSSRQRVMRRANGTRLCSWRIARCRRRWST